MSENSHDIRNWLQLVAYLALIIVKAKRHVDVFSLDNELVASNPADTGSGSRAYNRRPYKPPPYVPRCFRHIYLAPLYIPLLNLRKQTSAKRYSSCFYCAYSLGSTINFASNFLSSYSTLLCDRTASWQSIA
jgi:hypothetical protein